MFLKLKRKAIKRIEKLAKQNDESVLEILRSLFEFGIILSEIREQRGPNQKIFIGDPEEGMDEMIEVEDL